ncbi:MAG: DUF58 domain-containing protein [Candidatus Eremiobacteraeota bacterium]|nr:DUF58 domain-containing protein [Candidatus Eremiobacteraeota bacterium]
MKRRFNLWLPIWLTPRALCLSAGVAALFALGGAAPAAIALAYLAAGALALALVADASLGPRARAIAVEREPISHLALRVPATLGYALTNHANRLIRFGIIDTPVERLESAQDEVSGDAVAAGVTIIQRTVMPRSRGTIEFGPLYVWYENSIGLLRRRLRFEAPATARVFPDLSAVERYGSLRARNRLIDAGLRKMRQRGAGAEFESLREWSAGDAFRAIDWKATARRGRVMVAQYEVERSQNVMLVLDAGRLMTPRLGDQRKFDYAITAALSVASIAGLASDKVGLVAFAREILVAQAPRATAASLARLAGQVHDLEPRFEEADYAAAFSYLRAHLHKRSLIVFFTDMVDPVAQSTMLAEIGTLARRHVVVVAFMNDAAIDDALAAEPQTSLDVYAAGVALGLRQERRTAAAVIERLGARVIDVPAARLNASLIDEYLRVKQRGLV